MIIQYIIEKIVYPKFKNKTVLGNHLMTYREEMQKCLRLKDHNSPPILWELDNKLAIITGAFRYEAIDIADPELIPNLEKRIQYTIDNINTILNNYD